jgi:hypothetical protein
MSPNLSWDTFSTRKREEVAFLKSYVYYKFESEILATPAYLWLIQNIWEIANFLS